VLSSPCVRWRRPRSPRIDVITAINGETVADPSDVVARVRGAAEGATLEFRVTRDKKELTLKAVLEP